MAYLIDKDAVVAEIKRRINEINLDTIEDWRYRLQREHDIEIMKNILSLIDTFEVKEADLEKEIQRQYNVHKNPDNSIAKDCVIMTKDGFEYFAKYFFELGMQVSNKAQKGK